MLDGLQYVVVQVTILATVAALVAGLLGWLLGRRSGTRHALRRIDQLIDAVPALTPTPMRTPEPAAEVPAVAPFVPPSEPGTPSPGLMAPIETPVRPTETPVRPTETPVAPNLNTASVDAVPPGVGRPATTPYVPPVAASSSTGARRSATVEEVQYLRRQLRARDRELGRVEAGVLAAWDRVVPQLEGRIDQLSAENDELRHRLRDADEHADSDAMTMERLRGVVADRDSKLAELRQQV